MKRCLFLSMFVTLMLTGSAAFAADECTKITATGHPQYPVIAYKDGDNIVGAAPTLVATTGPTIGILFLVASASISASTSSRGGSSE